MKNKSKAKAVKAETELSTEEYRIYILTRKVMALHEGCLLACAVLSDVGKLTPRGKVSKYLKALRLMLKNRADKNQL